MRGTPKVLLFMRVVTLMPLVLLICKRAKTSFIRIKHKFSDRHFVLMQVHIYNKSWVVDNVPHRKLFLQLKGERIQFLF